ncbi:hypothetical protein [Herbiconiux liukaitaii]|uniref:hypothetical protein n=1 Tax=Herbiconiux liukaitaii TaxID=3342799 RepID=UPI0035B9AC55
MLRIRRTRWKVLFVVAGVALVGAANAVFLPRILPFPVHLFAGDVLLLAVYFVGTRAFRGRGEPIAPPRARWRMTSRPRAGFVIGTLLALNAALSIVSVVTSADDALIFALSTVRDGALAFLYLRSSIRLRRHPPATEPTPIPLPKWKPLKT